jgi:hypothetical protein
MNSRSVKAALLSILFGPMLMRADIVFSNLTSPDTSNNAYGVCGVVYGCQNNALAEEFIPSANYLLTDAQMLVIVLPSDNSSPVISAFDVFLDSNDSAVPGGAPGSQIAQLGSGLAATTALFPGSLVTTNPITASITLTAGTPYWLVLTGEPNTNTFIGWVGGGALTTRAISDDGGSTWNSATPSDVEFEIDGTPVVTSPVPEPASFGLLAGIATLLYGIKRRYARA